MLESRPRLGISEDAANHVRIQSELNKQNTEVFVKSQLSILKQEQADLYDYLWVLPVEGALSPAEIAGFGLGIALGYAALPLSHRREILTEDQIKAADRNLEDHLVLQEDEEEAEFDCWAVDISWFLNKLEIDSPPFAKLREEKERSIPNETVQASLNFGIASVLLPFYLRAEAREIEASIWVD